MITIQESVKNYLNNPNMDCWYIEKLPIELVTSRKIPNERLDKHYQFKNLCKFFNLLYNGNFAVDYETYCARNHNNFFFMKYMFQSLVNKGQIHPIGGVALSTEDVSDRDDVTNTVNWQSFKILKDFRVAIVSGSFRIEELYLIGAKHLKAIFNTPRGLKPYKDAIKINNLEELCKLVYDEDSSIHTYIRMTTLGEPVGEAGYNLPKSIGALCVGDGNNQNDKKGFFGEDLFEYLKIIKKTFPLKVYINASSTESFNNCKERIIKNASVWNKKIKNRTKLTGWVDRTHQFEYEYLSQFKVDAEDIFRLEFIHTREGYENISLTDEGFIIYTTDEVEWDFNIYELFFFTTTKKVCCKSNDNLVVINTHHPLWDVKVTDFEKYIQKLPNKYTNLK